jgi:hypothetical protein
VAEGLGGTRRFWLRKPAKTANSPNNTVKHATLLVLSLVLIAVHLSISIVNSTYIIIHDFDTLRSVVTSVISAPGGALDHKLFLPFFYPSPIIPMRWI